MAAADKKQFRVCLFKAALSVTPAADRQACMRMTELAGVPASWVVAEKFQKSEFDRLGHFAYFESGVMEMRG